MRIKLLFILALLCTVMQGAWAQNGIYCTASDVGRVVCTDGNIYDNVSAATAAGSHAVAKIIWVDEKNKKGLALNLWDEGYANRTDGIERCNNKNTSGPVAGAAWKLATKDEWDTMIDAAGGQQNLANGFSSVGGNNLNTSYGYYATSSVTSYAPNRQYYVYKFGSYSGWTDSKNDLACLVRPCLTFNLLTLYTINNQNDWFNFCDKVNGGDTFSDKYVKITCNDHWLPIVSEMAGTDETHSFQGVFDGNGHTITFNVTVTATEDYCAPFRHVKNAVIKNLHVDGSIYTSQKFAAGFVGESHGALSITNSRSSINITGSRSGDGTYGGFVATLSGADNTITIDGCVFDGSFATTNGTTNCGGFIGWPVYNRPTISNSLMKPSSVAAGMLVNTFARWHTTYQPTITNCYYVATDNLPTNQGTAAYAPATAPANLGSLVEDYDMVEAYATGILFDGKYYVAPASISLANAADNSTTISNANGCVADVTLQDRTLYKDGAWNTICLPFNVTLAGSPLEGAEARTLNSASIEGTTLNLTFDGRVDELGRLDQSFSGMQQSLVNYIDEMKQTTAAKAAIENELKVASDIQMSMVPRIFPAFPNRQDIDLYASMTPAKEVGGDLYDYFVQNEKLYFCVGDVSGKGVPASLFMAVTRNLFRIFAQQGHSPESIATGINRFLSQDNNQLMFVTMFIGQLDLQTGHMDFCNCGHNPPVIVTPGEPARFMPVKYANQPLGIMEGMPFQGESLEQTRGSLFLFYTDGLNEAENPDHDQFGDDAILEMMTQLSQLPSDLVIAQLKAAVEKHRNGAAPNDDLTLVALRLL